MTAMGKVMRAIGLMSGTSMDGVDVALIETDGEDAIRRGPNATVVYPPEFRALLARAVDEAAAISDRGQRTGCLAEAERQLTERHVDAVLRFMGDRMLQPMAIDVV